MTDPGVEGRGPPFAGSVEGLLLIALAAAPWPYGSSADPVRGVLTAILLSAGGVYCLGLAKAERGLPSLTLAAGGLPALALVQIGLGRSAAPIATAEAGVELAAMLGVLVFWFERAQDRGAAARLSLVVLGVSWAQAVFGAVQWSLAPDRIYGQEAPGVTMPFGSFVNHNHFAGLVEMGGILALGMALGRARREGNVTPGVVGLAGVAAGLVGVLAASGSRGGFVAFVAGLCVLGFLWLRVRRHRAGLLAGLGLGAAGLALLAFGLLVVPVGARNRLVTALSGGVDASARYRLDVAGGTLRLAAAHPVWGSGLGAFSDAFPAFKHGHGEVRTTHAESDVLEFLAEGGLLGLLVAGGLGLALLRGLDERLTLGRNPTRVGLAVGAAAAVAAFSVHSLLDFNARIPSNALVLASLAGLFGSPRSARAPWGGRALSAGTGLLLLLLSGAMAWRAAGAWRLEAAQGVSSPQERLLALDDLIAGHRVLPEAYALRAATRLALAERGGALGGPRLARAEADSRKALALRPAWGEAWAQLGIVRFRRSDAPGARAAFDEAMRLDPTHLGIGLARAEVLAGMDGTPGGLQELRRLLAANPDWPREQAMAAVRRFSEDPRAAEPLRAP